MFYDKLIELCEQHGINITTFASEAGFAKGSPSSWQKGSAPSSTALIKTAKYFGVSTDFLLDLDDVPSRRQQNSPTQAEMEMLSEFRAATPVARALAWASAHAVLGAAIAQQEPIGHALTHDESSGHLFDQDEPLGHAMSTPASQLPIEGYAAAGNPLFDREANGKSVSVQEKYTAKDMNGHRFFVVEARGDSMEPMIPDGTPVVVQRDLKPLSGEVALVSLDNATDEPEYVIKLVRYLPNEIELSSYNKAYKPFRRPLSEVISTEKVVHILKDV